MKESVLITGGAGFIGSHTADLLLKKGYKARILDNLSSKTHSGKWPRYLDKRIEKIKGDVRIKKHWEKALKGVDYVIHLAAQMDLIPEFSKFFEVNTLGTANLYEVIVAKKIPIKKVVIASSQFVYGQGRWLCKNDGEVFPKDRENKNLRKGIWDPFCPICGDKIGYLNNKENHIDPPNQYAISKYTQELIAFKLGKLNNIPSVALRYSIAHGPRQSLKNLYSGALRIFTLQLLNNEELSIFEDGQQLRDYVSVYDVARANLTVLESRKADYEVFNVGGGRAYTVLELAGMVSKGLGIKPKFDISGIYRVGDIRHAVSDIIKLKKLGWKPTFSEIETVKEFISWARENLIQSSNTSLVAKEMTKLGILRKTS